MEDIEGRLLHLLTPNKWNATGGGCWEWNRPPRKGYGVVSTRIGGRPIGRGAHRVALRAKLGRPISPGMLACHTCDNPICVNPDHLYEGTPAQNMQDAIRRGRDGDSRLKGGLATRKLTLAQAAEIRERVAAGAYQSDMSREYGVSKQVVSDIVNGRHYRFGWAVPHRAATARRRFTDDQIREAKARVRAGESKTSVEKSLGMSGGTMTRIMQGKLYGDID